MSPPSSFFPPTPCTFKRRVQATPHLPWLRVCATVTLSCVCAGAPFHGGMPSACSGRLCVSTHTPLVLSACDDTPLSHHVTHARLSSSHPTHLVCAYLLACLLQIRTASMRATSDRKAVFGRERTMGKPLVYTPPRVTSLPSSSSSSSSSGATGGAGAGAGAGASARSSSSASRLGVGDSGAGALPRPGGLTTPGGGTSVAGSAPTPDELFSPVSAQALLPNQEV